MLITIGNVVAYAEIEKSKGNTKTVEITETAIFAKIRFKRAIEILRPNVVKPEDKKRMLDIFYACPNHRMTYFQFFQMLENDFKTDVEMGKGPIFKAWIREAISNYLDDFGSGYISINDWHAFLTLFNIDIGHK